MAETDFDTASLAAYLHITPQQVEKLAKRNEIPFRRVNGKLLFPQAEIHHWMEDRMGVLDETELVAVEGRLREPADQPVTVGGWLSVESIAVPLIARTRKSVISTISELAATTGLLWDAKKMATAVAAREDLQSTAMENGVAFLHPRRPQTNILGDNLLALGITSQGIPFGGGRTLTDVFFLICSTDDRSHLRILARLARLVSDPELLDALREGPDAAAVYQSILDSEEALES